MKRPRCIYVDDTGQRCRRPARANSQVCALGHGGLQLLFLSPDTAEALAWEEWETPDQAQAIVNRRHRP